MISLEIRLETLTLTHIGFKGTRFGLKGKIIVLDRVVAYEAMNNLALSLNPKL